MNYIKSLSFILFFVFIFSSCEDQVMIDLDSTVPKIVVDAVINDQPGPYYVKITKSSDYYQPNNFATINNAVVTISDNLGNSEELVETSEGLYATQNIKGTRGVVYTLKVSIDGKTYSSNNMIPLEKVDIDSLSYRFEDGSSIFYDEGYYFSSHFQDPSNIKNYYRGKVLINGQVYDFNNEDMSKNRDYDTNFWLINDKFSNGKYKNIKYPHKLKKGDIVSYELENLSESTYIYYRTLVDIIRGSNVAPANPISNFSEGVLGYFGAYSVDFKTIVIN